MGIRVRGGRPPMYMSQRLDILITFLSQFAYQPPPPASGNATLFVDQNTGNDNYTYDQIRNGAGALQWRTLGRAVRGSANISQEVQSQAARAGDVVQVNAGVYTATETSMSGSPFLIYQPANSGTAAQPIEFRANGFVDLRHTVSTGATVFGASQRNYIRWRGFYVNETTATPRIGLGPVALWHTTGSEIHECDLRGTNPAWGDNHNGIRVEDSFDCIVRNNRIDGFRDGNSHNGAGIIAYDSQRITVEHNEIMNCHAGVFVKGQVDRVQNSWVIRNNYIHNNIGMGVLLHGCSGADVYRNIIRTGRGGVEFLAAPDPVVLNSRVVNNTIYNMRDGFGFGAAFHAGAPGLGVTPLDNNTVANNIVMDADYMVFADTATDAQMQDLTNILFKHNLYHQFTNAANINFGNRNLAAWLAYGQDSNAVPSVFDNPDFMNAAAFDFHLRVGSPALNAGRDVLNLLGGGTTAPCNMGAYLVGDEVIGIQP